MTNTSRSICLIALFLCSILVSAIAEKTENGVTKPQAGQEQAKPAASKDDSSQKAQAKSTRSKQPAKTLDRECFLANEGQLVSEKFMATIRFDSVGKSGRQIRLSIKSSAQSFAFENENQAAEPKKIDMKPLERSWDISLKQVRESKSYGPLHFKRAQGLELFKQLNHYQIVFLLNKADQSKTQTFATAVAQKEEMKNYMSISCTFPKANFLKASEKGGSKPEEQKKLRTKRTKKNKKQQKDSSETNKESSKL